MNITLTSSLPFSVSIIPCIVANIFLTCVDILIALFCVGKLASYLYLLLPFKNTNGKIVTIKITERNIFATMHGIIETEKGNERSNP